MTQFSIQWNLCLNWLSQKSGQVQRNLIDQRDVESGYKRLAQLVMIA